jgi:dolichyl-phosphate beta-glucosyltransferase
VSAEEHSIEDWLQARAQDARQPALSIVIPAFNEERRLPPTLITIIDYLEAKGVDYELLVVDDGSRDGTAEMVRKFERIRSQVHLLRLPRNYGKGHAVRTGALSARGAVLVFLDADGATPIEELPSLLQALQSGADIAIGSRAKPSDEKRVRTLWLRRVLGRTFNTFVNSIILPGIYDSQCGFKAFLQQPGRFLFEQQQADGFSFDVEILHVAQRVNLKIQEIPVNWKNVPGSKVNLLTDSCRMFCDLFRFRFRHRNLSPHKYQEFLQAQDSSVTKL